MGIVAGPYCLRLIPESDIRSLRFIDELSLAFIAYASGAKLMLDKLEGKQPPPACTHSHTHIRTHPPPALPPVFVALPPSRSAALPLPVSCRTIRDLRPRCPPTLGATLSNGL